MKHISIVSARTTGLNSAFRTIQSVDIEDAPLGQGAFGEVYRAVRINGRTPSPPQVVKLLLDNGVGMAQRGFATVQELQGRLQKKNAEYLQSTGRALVDHIPALLGVPQFSFDGTLDGRRVVGYSANDLTAVGMEDFGRILEDDAKIRAFQNLSLSSKLQIASQLVSGFQFLSSHVGFIHADIKAEALFVDTKQLRCAVIDFDSGAVARGPHDKPTTFGTRQDWLAPEIVKQIDAPGNKTRAVKVDLFSDIWAVNIAIHYLLFGFHPFFFLTEISDRSVDAYFRRYRWPRVDPGFQYFRREHEALHRQYELFLQTKLPAALFEKFSVTFNEGYRDRTKRTTYGQWTTVLRTVNQPEIRRLSAVPPRIESFTVSKDFLSVPEPVRLAWKVTGAERIEIDNGIGDVTRRSYVDVLLRRDCAFTLTATSSSGVSARASVTVRVSKDPPSIIFFRTDRDFLQDPEPVELAWKVSDDASKVVIDGLGPVPREGKRRLAPRADTVYVLRATSYFGYSAEKRLEVRVSKEPPRIEEFTCNPPFVREGMETVIRWKVSRAERVEIKPDIGAVSGQGARKVRVKGETEFELSAKSYFGVPAKASLVVRVWKATTLANNKVTELAPRTPLTAKRTPGAASSASFST